MHKFELPFRPKLFKGYLVRPWYLTDLDSEDDGSDTDDSDTGDTGDDSGDDSGDTGDDTGDTGDDSGDDSGDTGDDSGDDSTVTVDVNGTTYTFSTEYTSEETAAVVAALEASVESEEDESLFDTVVETDDESVLGEYLGCYELSTESGVLTLASPEGVTDPEVYSAIVLHYNETTGEWENVEDVQIIDGYVYAVFTSTSPVAVYTLKKKYVATVTIGEDVTSYTTVAEAVTYAEANLASSSVITLTWNKCITESIGPLYSTTEGTVTLDLAGYTIYASVEDGYAINISGDASTTDVVVQNGSIIADEVTLGTINIADVYASLNELNLTASHVGGSNVVIDSVKAPMTDCVVTTENGNGIEIKATNTASLITIITTSTITTTNTDDNKYPAILLADVNSNAFAININTGCIITGDVYGVYNDSIAGKCYCYGEDAYLIAPTAVYVSEKHTAANGFYTGISKYPYINGSIVSDDTTTDVEVVALRFAYLSAKADDAYVGSGYGIYDNEDDVDTETYPYFCTQRRVVECTTADGVVSYRNSLNSSALSAAGTNGAVKLLEDASNTGVGSIAVDNVTVDLNGYTFTVTSSSGIYSTSKDYTFTIKNGSIVSTCKTAGCAAIKFTRGTLNVEDVTITTADDGSTNTNGIVIGNGSADYPATANVSGSTVINAPTGILVQNKTGATSVATLNVAEGVTINARSYAISGNGSYDGTVITVNGGTFTSTGTGAALYHPQSGELTINGGTFTGVVTGIQMCDGNLYFNDGTVTVTGENNIANKTGDGNIPDACAISVVNRSGYSSTYPTATIKGGTFKSANEKAVSAYAWSSDTKSEWDASEYINISGGNFSDIPDSGYIAEGYVCSTEAVNGLYTVSASE